MEGYALEIFFFTLLSVALSMACSHLDPRAADVYDGFPRAKFIASIGWQLVVFPVCVWLMIRDDSPQTLTDWLAFASKSRAELGGTPCYYFPALIAAQLKDFITGPITLWRSKKMFVHHVIVVLCSVYAETLQHGYGNLVLVTFALEVGSCTFNMATLMPGSNSVLWLYQVVMAAGHVFSLALFAVVAQSELSWTVKVVYGAIGVGVMIGRQLSALKHWRLSYLVSVPSSDKRL